MNRQLLQLCFEYIKCYQVLECLLAVDECADESLKLFRLMKNRTENLEHEIELCIVETDMRKQMVDGGKQ